MQTTLGICRVEDLKEQNYKSIRAVGKRLTTISMSLAFSDIVQS
jgi:hypothetical protein